MEVRNIAEFVAYCQERSSDASLPQDVELAENWADFSLRLEGQYGGHGAPMTEWIEEAYGRMGVQPTQEQLLRSHEILSRFWEYGEAFDTWFKSKVIIVAPPK